MQRWFSRTHPGILPFRLYALSNVASLLALIGYPVLFETHFTRPVQAKLWGIGFSIYAIASGFCAFKFWFASSVTVPNDTSVAPAPPLLDQRLLLARVTGLRLDPLTGDYRQSVSGRGSDSFSVGPAPVALLVKLHHLF